MPWITAIMLVFVVGMDIRRPGNSNFPAVDVHGGHQHGFPGRPTFGDDPWDHALNELNVHMINLSKFSGDPTFETQQRAARMEMVDSLMTTLVNQKSNETHLLARIREMLEIAKRIVDSHFRGDNPPLSRSELRRLENYANLIQKFERLKPRANPKGEPVVQRDIVKTDNILSLSENFPPPSVVLNG